MSTLDELPVGTVTFLSRTSRGSTRLLKRLGGEVYGQALDDHRRIDGPSGRGSGGDPATATRLWREVELAILAQAPIVPTYNRSQVDFVSERVGNYRFHRQWGVLLEQLWIG